MDDFVLMERVHGLGAGQFAAGLIAVLGGDFLEKCLEFAGFDEDGNRDVLGAGGLSFAAGEIFAEDFFGQRPGFRAGLFAELPVALELVMGSLPIRGRIHRFLGDDALPQCLLEGGKLRQRGVSAGECGQRHRGLVADLSRCGGEHRQARKINRLPRSPVGPGLANRLRREHFQEEQIQLLRVLQHGGHMLFGNGREIVRGLRQEMEDDAKVARDGLRTVRRQQAAKFPQHLEILRQWPQ